MEFAVKQNDGHLGPRQVDAHLIGHVAIFSRIPTD
jgi:hypothetical protein